MWCSSCYNHVSLINRIYPTDPGEAGAKTSNLSFLVFYAESRPQKLTKIGAYLEKRTARDISYSKIKNLKVTLTILTVLVGSKCKENLVLFLNSVVNILLKMLESPLNISLLDQISSTTVAFSGNHNHVILDVDPAFVIPYTKIIEILCKYVQDNDENQELQNQKRIASLKAIYAIVSADTFLKSPKIDTFLNNIIPALLTNIQERRSKGIKLYRSLSNTEINDVDLDNLAIESLNEIMQRINPATFDRVFNPIYKYLEENKCLLNRKYLLKLFEIFTKTIAPQYRYLLVLYSLKHLKDYSSDIKIQTNIVYILSNIIKNGGGSVVTHIEILDILTKSLFETLKNTEKFNNKEIENLETAYIDCISSFTSKINHPEQINDIMSYLMNRLNIIDTPNNTPFTNSSNNSDKILYKCRMVIIRSLRFILEQRAEAIKNNDLLSNTPIPIELFTSSLQFLMDSSMDLRLQYYFFLLLLMEQINGFSALDDKKAYTTKYLFMQNIHKTLFNYSQLASNKPIDFIMIINILIKNIQLFMYDAIVAVIPMLFELEKIVKEKNCQSKTDIALQIAKETLIVESIEYIALYLENEPLIKYIDEVKENKIKNNEWCPVSFNSAVISQWMNKDFKDIEWRYDELTTSTQFLDQENIIELLCNDKELNSEVNNLSGLLHERYNFNKILKLAKEEELGKSNSTKRTSISSVIRDPKLVRVSIPPPMLRDITHASIHIEDLKEVLGSFEHLDKLKNDENIIAYDDEDNQEISNEVNQLLDEIKLNSQNSKGSASSAKLINQPILSSYEKSFSSLKRPIITTQDEYPMMSMDAPKSYQDTILPDHIIHY